MEAPCDVTRLFGHVDELTDYPTWMPLAHRVSRLDPEPDGRPAWEVELRARLGPFARSKRLRMVRTVHDPSADMRNSMFDSVDSGPMYLTSEPPLLLGQH